jgi:hypothetical protein
MSMTITAIAEPPYSAKNLNINTSLLLIKLPHTGVLI